MLRFCRQDCHFADKDRGCLMGSRLTCLPCSMYLRNLPNRTTSDHISIVFGRNAGNRARRALVISVLSLIMSGIALALWQGDSTEPPAVPMEQVRTAAGAVVDKDRTGPGSTSQGSNRPVVKQLDATK